ncbi:MAG: hypothetical protein IKO75_14160 [Bacteroidales bacterium]|nr:hypothetical protein [Bacteroidales bacterium]
MKRRSPMQWKMKKLLVFLLTLIGFASVSCDRSGDYESYYGTVNVPYEEKTAVNDNSATPSPYGTDIDDVITEIPTEE